MATNVNEVSVIANTSGAIRMRVDFVASLMRIKLNLSINDLSIVFRFFQEAQWDSLPGIGSTIKNFLCLVGMQSLYIIPVQFTDTLENFGKLPFV